MCLSAGGRSDHSDPDDYVEGGGEKRRRDRKGTNVDLFVQSAVSSDQIWDDLHFVRTKQK